MRPTWNSDIPQYWLDKGYTIEYLTNSYWWYNVATFLLIGMAVLNYIGTWWIRKNLSFLQKIDEAPMSRLEKYAQACELGREPAMNFISSTLITQDRAFIVMRVVLALWSMTLTAVAWEGVRSLFYGFYYPIASILTVYVSRNRDLIVEGFGKKVQTINKLLSFLFNCQAPLRLFIALTWWTQWFGVSRYRDMSRAHDLSKFVLFNKEFAPPLFLLVELLWFDTTVTFCGAWAPIFAGMTSVLGMLKDVVIEPPQALAKPITNPAGSLPMFWIWIFGMPLTQWALALFCLLKVFIFKKIDVIGDRLTYRQECIVNFRKRQAFNKEFGNQITEERKTTMKNSYKNLGRHSMKISVMERRKTKV
ncbi:unnamed protein product [Oikopleura dioica]|uniref:Uncharacterized protein n=1 Tax=Oikopleura dioica TaxID=34765 RepID=E4XQ16_OIKDI|nr:unnamed protein product [Oikopleura dioica]